MSKIIALQSYPTTEGLIQTVPILTAKLNGQPIATLGSILIHKTFGADNPIEFVTGITLNNKPLTFVGAKTLGGATIMDGGTTTANIKNGAVYNGQSTTTGIEEEEEEEESSKTIALVSSYAMQQVQEQAKQMASSTFYLFMKVYFHGGIPIAAYNALYKAMSNKEELNPEIKVYKMGLGRDAAWNHKYKEIRIREKWVLEAVEGKEGSSGEEKELSIAKAKSMLFEGLLEEYGHYIDDLLRNSYSSVGEDSPGDEGALIKRYFLTTFDPFTDSEINFGTAIIDGVETPLLLDFKDFTQAFQRIEEDLKSADEEYFGAGEGDALLEHYGHLGLERVLENNNILSQKELSHLYLGNYMRDMSQIIVPPMYQINENDYNYLKKMKPSMNAHNWVDSWKISRKGFTLIVELLAAGQMRKITEGEGGPDAVEGPVNIDLTNAKDAVPDTTLAQKVRGFIADRLMDLGLLAVQVSLDYWLFVLHYDRITTEELGVYKPEEHLDNPIDVMIYDELNGDKFYCKEDAKPGIDPVLGMKMHIRQEKLGFEQIGIPECTGTYKKDGSSKGQIPTGFHYIEGQIDKFYKKYREAAPGKERNNTLKYLGNALHVLEDFFAHTNFCELSLIKAGISVYPWVDLNDEELKNFSTDGRFKIKDTVDHTKKENIEEKITSFKSEVEISSYFSSRGTYTKLPDFIYKGFYFSHLPKDEADEGKTKLYIADKQSDDSYHVKLALAVKRLEMGGVNYASQIPLVSGYFSTLDTVHSLLHAVEKVFEPKEITFTGVLLANEGITGKDFEKISLDISDMIILTVLNDLNQTQQEREKSGIETGINASTILEYYKKYITYRGVAISIIAALKKKNPLLIILGEILNRSLNTLYVSIANVVGKLITECLELSAASITAFQNTELKREIGTNPSHSQLAKDSPEHPLHSLAAEYAKDAVLQVGKILEKLKFDKVLEDNSYVDATAFKNKFKELMVHPVKSSWMDDITIKWVQSHGHKFSPLQDTERKRKEMSKLGDHVKVTMAELKARYNALLQMVDDAEDHLNAFLKKLDEYISDAKNISDGLTDEILDKYNDVLHTMDREYLIYKQRITNKTKRLAKVTQHKKEELNEEINKLNIKFEKIINEQFKKGNEILKEVEESLPEIFNDVEKELHDFYINLKGEELSYHKMDSNNMFKYNLMNYMEEYEPENAERYRNLVALQKIEKENTKNYVSTSAVAKLELLDPLKKDNTALA